jgi:phage terminase Nu1 subunit (DNA packaging protein)
MEDQIISKADAASLLGLSYQRVDQMAQSGHIKRVGRGQFSMISAVQGYIGLLRDAAKRQTEKAGNKRVSDARAREIEVRTAQRLGELVPLAIYDEMIDGFAGVVRSELAGLPASCSRNLAERRVIERETNARLHRIAEFAMAQARVATVRGADDPFRTDGAGSVVDGE